MEIKLLNNLTIMCPAIILALNRRLKVRGWINFLIVSIKTIKNLNNKGLPLGVILIKIL